MKLRALLTILALAVSPALFPEPGRAASGRDGAVRITLHDQDLLDQDGRPLRFRRDVVGDRIVAITFTYTTCTTICPILDSIFANVQGKLGDRLGRDVFLITVSIDPVNDIPARLKAYSRKLNARPGWSFLTGKKVDVDKVLLGLDMYTADIYNHSPSIIVGDGKTGVWRRFYGFPSADKILAALNELEKGRRR
jgi:protein SCO1